MRKSLLILFILTFSLSAFAFIGKKSLHTEPLFQLTGGLVYSSIDLSRYTNSKPYKGFHGKLTTHIASTVFLSAEYSTFPVHESPSAWDDVRTRKFDLNGRVVFGTFNDRTKIFAFTGINRHEWSGRRTKFTDLDQLSKGFHEGTYVEVNRWGVNFGCGITQELYDNISLICDYRFNLSKAYNFEKVGVMDVMTTIGINYSIPYPQKSDKVKKFGIGKKIYKWTDKGAK